MTLLLKRSLSHPLRWLQAALLLVAVGGSACSLATEYPPSRAFMEGFTVSQPPVSHLQAPELDSVDAPLLDAVVTPAASFDFGPQHCFQLAHSQRGTRLLSQVPACFSEFFHFFAYFRNVFGHHIVINAP